MGFLNSIGDRLKETFWSKKGQTLVEYGLLLVLIAVVVYLMLQGFGETENSVYSKINSWASKVAGQ